MADTNNHALRLIRRGASADDDSNSAAPAVTTLAGARSASAGFVNGVGSNARFSAPSGVAFSGDATTLFVADTNNNALRAIVLATGAVTAVQSSEAVAKATTSLRGFLSKAGDKAAAKAQKEKADFNDDE